MQLCLSCAFVCFRSADRCGGAKGSCRTTQGGSSGKREGVGEEGAVSSGGGVTQNGSPAGGEVRILSGFVSVAHIRHELC